MFNAKYLVAVSLVAATSIAASAKADSPRCELLTYKPTEVAPLYDTIYAARGGTIQRLKGAQVFILARPGLTPEWLRLDLEQHILAMRQQRMQGCPLANEGVKLAVVSGGNGFWVQITAKDPDSAKIVLQQAQELVRLNSSK